MGEHAAERGRERNAFAREGREIDMAHKTGAGLLGRDHLEELLLPRRVADGGEWIAPPFRRSK